MIAEFTSLLVLVSVGRESVIAYSLFDRLDQEIGPVYFTNIVFRHGHRTAELDFKEVMLSYAANNPENASMVTKLGAKHLFNVGHRLRKRYDHLVPKRGLFDPNLVSVLSNEAAPLVLSARSLLAGMFPPNRDEIWGPVRMVPVPLRTLMDSEDKFIDVIGSNCKKWNDEYDSIRKTNEYADFAKKYSWVLEASMRVYSTTFNNTDPFSLVSVLNSLTTCPEDPLLPVSAQEMALIENIEEPIMANFYVMTYNTSMKRMLTGPLLQKMLGDMTQALESEPLPTKRFAIYSAAERTLAVFLFSMSVDNALKKSPKYGSAILVELRVASNNTAYVTFVYQNSYNLDDEPELLNSSLCPNPCRLDTLIEATKPLMPLVGEDECSEDSVE